MDILIGIVTSVLGKIAECTIEPIGHQLSYIVYYRRHISDLKTQIQLLQDEIDKLQHLIDEAKNRGEEIENNVQNWNNTVSDIIQKSQSFFEVENQANTRCSKRSFLNLTSRRQQSRKAKKMADAVANEIEKARKISCNKISYRSTFHGSVENKGYEAFTSRFSTLTKIMDALKDPNVSKIGLYGMPGIGKTMLAKEVENQALKQQLFDVAILVPISKTPDFKDIQQIIADKLALEFYEKAVPTRADRLRDQLMKQKKKILIILDDVWEKLKLDDVGISFREDQKESKILLTTRFDSVCNDMDTERKFHVGLLNIDESTSLFYKIVGSTVKNNCVDDLAAEIIKECADLPLVITTIASALKEKKRPIWEHVLRGLRKSNPTDIDGVQGNVYSSIQLSYDFLNVDARSLLVLCSLHEEDADIDLDLLLKCSLGFDLFQGIDKVEEVKAKVFYLVDNLKTSSLLLDGRSPNYVKMHDVIRDVVISIASRDKRMHITQDVVQLEESLPMYEDSIAISLLHNNDERVRLSEKLVCPRLKLFLMFGSNRSSEIPESFFEEARELRVLLLMSACFERVQSSFLVLQNLQTLCLRDCKLEDTASIGELKSLRILDLAGSDIEKLPKEIGQLTKLKLLDLSNCQLLKTIEPDIISRLTSLEELNMRYSFTSWAIDEVSGERRNNASLVELSGLQLSTLYLNVTDTTVLPKMKWLNEKCLKRYEILIGDNWEWSWDARGISTRLAVKLNHFSDLDEYKIQTLLKTSEEVCLDGLVGIGRDVFFALDKDGASQFKHLEFENNDEIQYVLNYSDQIHVSAFSKLESLVLSGLMNLEKICRGKLAIDSFGKLRIVRVTSCAKLKYLLPLSATRRLESIKVDGCFMMEEIIVRGEDYSQNISNDAIDDKIEFPQLHTLNLYSLPQLKRFCYDLKMMTSISERIEEPTDANTAFSLFNQKFAFPALREMFIRSIDNLEKIWEYPWPSTSADHSFRKLEEIYVSNCKNLQKVLPSPMRARRLANLRRLVISDCEMLQEVFEIERSNTVEEREATASQLSYLGLRYLPKLKHVWPKDSQGSSHLLFRNLKEINVDGCHNLESLCPPSVAKGLLQLQTLYIKDCKMLKEIISKDQEEEETVPHRVFFPQLTRLSLGRLPQLMSFYPAEPQGLSFQEEKSGLIEANYPIKQQQPHSLMDKVAFPILRNIYIEFMDNLKTIWACPSTAADSFSKLEEIDVRHCKNLEKIIPSSMWSTLQKLTKLSIYNCEMVEEVFEIETRSNVEETTTQLRNLNLRDLPKPRHMWTKDPQDNHILFQNLKDIGLSDCPKLESLFPPSIAKGLLRLERLEISDCEMLKEIVSKEEEETDGIEKMPKFVLPQLKYLKLTNLPNLVSFYPTLHTSEWPSLESLKVKECAKVTVLAMKVVSRIIEEEKSGILAPINSQTQKPFFLMEKVIFPELKSLILTGNIDFPEEFAKVFSSLRELQLFQRPRLLHLWEDVIQNLETLNLNECESLKKLVLSSSVSFQNLTTLMVSKCCGLLNLVTLPIAKSLGQKLRRMSISECENMMEIIAKEEEGGDAEGGEIVFSQLEILILYNLPSLAHFYNGNYMMRFPNLERAIVSGCFELHSFCIHGVITHKLDKIFTIATLYLDLFHTEWLFDQIEYYCILGGELWKGDINMTLEELWKTRHNNPLTSIQEEDAQKDIEKNSQEISENESEDESKRSSGRDSGEDSEQDMEEDFKGDFKKDFQQEDSKNNSEEDSASISDLEEDSEKDSKEDADDDDEDTKNDNNYVEDFDEDSEKTSEESSEEDSKEDIEEDSEESSEEDSDKKDQSTEEASEKDLEDNFEEKSKTDSSEDKEEDSSHSEQNSEDS